MPPKAKYTKEEILEIAYQTVRKEGIDALSARNLAAALGCSTAPIFTAFTSIEEIKEAVKKRAWALYTQYLDQGLAQALPFKGTGLKYVEFAKDEPMLFRMLFMSPADSGTVSHYFPSGDDNEPRVRGSVEQGYGMSEEQAKRLYNYLSVYTHGLAVMFAQRQCVFTMEDVSHMLSELFAALTKGEKE